MTQDGTVVARASTLFLRRGEQPTDEIWTSPVTMPPVPPTPDPIPRGLITLVWMYGKDEHTPGTGFGLAAWQHSGPKPIWVRDIRPLAASSEECHVGKECASTWRARGSP